MRNMSLTAIAVIVGVSFATAAKAEPQVEVLHWWTSGGEARAIQVLVDDFKAAGGTWTDMPVAGGGGDAARTALKARVLSGNPPTAFQMKGPSIQEWYEEGALSTGIDAIAKEQNWDAVLPAQIADHMKCEGKYCAAPVNVHRIDWFWANPAVLAKAGVAMPTTWDQFNAAADKLQAMGITPLAHGGQSWQDATVFEAVALGIMVLAGHFQRRFHRLAAGITEEDAVGEGRLDEPFGQANLFRNPIEVGAMPEPARLRRQRLDEARVAVAEAGDRDAGPEIQIPFSVGGIKVHPLAPLEGKVGPGISGHDRRYHRRTLPQPRATGSSRAPSKESGPVS